MKRPLLIFGCGGHGKVIADAALSAGVEVLGFADDSVALRGEQVLGLPVLSIGLDETARLCTERAAEIVFAIGDNRARARMFGEARRLGLGLATVVHPSAVVAASAVIGAGTVLFARSVVNPDVRIGDNAIVNTAVSIDHDGEIGAHVHLSPGVILGGTVRIGEGAHLAVGAAVRNNVSVGAWSVVGVGAAVVSDLPDNVVAYGVPARVVRQNAR